MPNTLLVSRLGEQTWVALTRGSRIVELHVASPARPDPVERIVRGRVVRVQSGIQAALVEIGMERPALLRAGDLPWESPASTPAPPIQDRLKAGSDLTVQVVRGPSAGKGARVTARIGLAGERLVCRPFEAVRKVSRRVVEPGERQRLEKLLARCPGETGWIARTGSAGAGEEQIVAEARELLARWRRIEQGAARTGPPAVLEPEPGLVDRLLRELPATGLERVVVDTPEDRERIGSRMPRVELHPGPEPLARARGLLDEAARARSPRVPLPSGGHLVIEPTEALVAIDVNTSGFEGTALEANLEAVAEVTRQLRLRDLGGTVVIDLIQMAEEEDRRSVREAIERALVDDRARTRIVGWSDRRLLHLVRQRVGPGLEALSDAEARGQSGR